jgi:hypothetical protein
MNLQRCDVVLAGGAWQQDLIAFYPGGANLVLNFTTTNVVPCGLDMCGTLVGFQGGIILSGSVGGVDPSRYGLFGNHNAAGSPRPHRRCGPSRNDYGLGLRWPSRLVATASEDRLMIDRLRMPQSAIDAMAKPLRQMSSGDCRRPLSTGSANSACAKENCGLVD